MELINAVAECVGRNRAGYARSRARMLDAGHAGDMTTVRCERLAMDTRNDELRGMRALAHEMGMERETFNAMADTAQAALAHM